MRYAFLVLLLFHGSLSWGHARLLQNGALAPRSNNAGLKTGPCGGVLKTANAPVFQPGSTITLQWQETINHPGRFEFSFSPAGDANFVLLKTVIDDQNAGVALPHNFSTTLTLPSTPCTGCTLQMIQVMTENPANPTYYFSCADLQIASGTVGTGTTSPTMPTPMPGPMPAPAPAAGESCH